MKTSRVILAAVLGSSLVLGPSVGFAASSTPAGHVPAGQSLRVRVNLPEAVLCDGSVRLEKGAYDVEIRSLGDGSVRASFFRGGKKVGQASGKTLEVVVQGGLQPGAAASVQKVQPGAADAVVVQGGMQPNAVPSFASLGFTPQSQASFQKHGNQMNLFLKGNGAVAILIGLLVPAVQKVREAAAAPR